MGGKKENTIVGIIGYILAPLIIEWVLNVLVKTGVQIIFGGPGVNLNQYATEFTTAAAVMTLPVMIWMYRRDQRKALPQKNPGKRNGMVPAYALLAVMGISACIAMNALLMMAGLPDSSEGYRQVSETMYQSPLWIQVLGLGILIPAKEEMVYRAVFYGRMRESVPVKEAILISSALFGIGHGNLVQFFFAAVMGALLAGVYELSASACAPVFLHSIINLTSLVLTWTGCFAWVMGGALRAATVTVVSASVAAGMYWGYRSILK